MSQSWFMPVDPDSTSERPDCVACATPMWLARIRPTDKADHDERTFECPTCNSVTVKIVKFR